MLRYFRNVVKLTLGFRQLYPIAQHHDAAVKCVQNLIFKPVFIYIYIIYSTSFWVGWLWSSKQLPYASCTVLYLELLQTQPRYTLFLVKRACLQQGLASSVAAQSYCTIAHSWHFPLGVLTVNVFD